jgi:outer membrane protein
VEVWQLQQLYSLVTKAKKKQVQLLHLLLQSQLTEKVVFVNTDSLLTNYQFYKDAQKEFENKGYRLQVDLGQRERALQTEGAAIQQRAQAMTQAELQAADMMLRKKAGELQQYSQQKQAALAQEQAKKQEELYQTFVSISKSTMLRTNTSLF